MTQAHAHMGPHEPAISDQEYQARLDRLARHPALHEQFTRIRPGEFSGMQHLLLGVGAVGLALTVVGGFVYDIRHALAAYEIGVLAATAMALGALFFVMVFHMTNAGWSTTLRRQYENLAAMLPICMAMVGVALVIEIVSGGVLLRWIGMDPHSDHLLEHKSGYLNTTFLIIRFAVYAGIWTFLSLRLRGWSIEQDTSGDRWLSRRCRFNSGWGLLAFALSTAFFAFDFLMGMDFRFYSTMWGVYYFASSAFGSLAMLAVVFSFLKMRGKLGELVESEHLHDHGKLMFCFTVFWAYIAFGQYFLIWYGNIPEETAYYVFRRSGGWAILGQVLIAVHFFVPFFLLISRVPKRNPKVLGALAFILIAAHVLDMVWIIKPAVDAGGELAPMSWWVDVAAVLGVFSVLGFFLLRAAASAALVPMKDPRLEYALEHVNYV
ncbi:MAG: hypothetical protein DYG94_03255 [Leptolyngbya sp. PLA3]|nr:MAG: hypothetical protein EDM82_11045 [Cyanobacteria bacterium CYA]MCE7967748.1 hypothetical protein [Leptolyngbya sp. PL-A3]